MTRKIRPSDPSYKNEEDAMCILVTSVVNGEPLVPRDGLTWTVADCCRLINLGKTLLLARANKTDKPACIDDETPIEKFFQ